MLAEFCHPEKLTGFGKETTLGGVWRCPRWDSCCRSLRSLIPPRLTAKELKQKHRFRVQK